MLGITKIHLDIILGLTKNGLLSAFAMKYAIWSRECGISVKFSLTVFIHVLLGVIKQLNQLTILANPVKGELNR